MSYLSQGIKLACLLYACVEQVSNVYLLLPNRVCTRHSLIYSFLAWFSSGP